VDARNPANQSIIFDKVKPNITDLDIKAATKTSGVAPPKSAKAATSVRVDNRRPPGSVSSSQEPKVTTVVHAKALLKTRNFKLT
jgi:hypothetical protein